MATGTSSTFADLIEVCVLPRPNPPATGTASHNRASLFLLQRIANNPEATYDGEDDSTAIILRGYDPWTCFCGGWGCSTALYASHTYCFCVDLANHTV